MKNNDYTVIKGCEMDSSVGPEEKYHDLQITAKAYQNRANYYEKKNDELKDQISDYETERKDLTGRLEKIFELTSHDSESQKNLIKKLDQIRELTKY